MCDCVRGGRASSTEESGRGRGVRLTGVFTGQKVRTRNEFLFDRWRGERSNGACFECEYAPVPRVSRDETKPCGPLTL